MNFCRISVSMAATLLSVSSADAAAPIAGRWLTTERDSIIEIAPCNAVRGTVLCGRVVRVLKASADGKAMTDSHNPSPALRNRPIQGIDVLNEMSDTGSDWRGRIYDPRSGKSYKSILTRKADGNLAVQGCITFICKSFIWTPAR